MNQKDSEFGNEIKIDCNQQSLIRSPPKEDNH